MATASVIPNGLSAGNRLSAMWFQKLLDAMRRYRPVAGRNITITETPNGCIINGTPGGGQAVAARTQLAPFAVRWMEHPAAEEGGETGGEWQIYLPLGCLSVNAAVSVPDNDQAVDAEGKPIRDWYRIEDPQDGDADISDIGGKQCKSWVVSVIAQPWPRFKATTMLDDTDYGEGMKKLSVATIGIAETDDGESGVRTERRVSQMLSSSQVLTRDVSSRFSLVYRTAGDINAKVAKFSPFVVNQRMTFGRQEASISQDTEIPDGAESVFLHISHGTENFTIEVVTSKGDDDLDNTFLTLYDLDKGVAKADYRSVLDDLPFYNN